MLNNVPYFRNNSFILFEYVLLSLLRTYQKYCIVIVVAILRRYQYVYSMLFYKETTQACPFIIRFGTKFDHPPIFLYFWWPGNSRQYMYKLHADLSHPRRQHIKVVSILETIPLQYYNLNDSRFYV